MTPQELEVRDKEYELALAWWKHLGKANQLRLVHRHYACWNLDMVWAYKPALIKIWKDEGNYVK